MLTVAKVFSMLGNPNSLAPLALKDTASCLGMTAGSLVTGREEGVDRFIDEFGTEIIWLGGIPFYKWLFNKIIYKLFNFDYKIDARNLKNKEIFEKIKKYAPTEKIKKQFENVEKRQKSFKKLAIARFVVSTLLAAGSYVGLTKLKQNYTDKKIRQNLIKEHENKIKNEKSQQNPNFKGVGKFIEELAISPVKNMYIMDGFITTERLTDSRSPQEFFGYAIKEASCLCFLYYAGGKIQSFFENRANNKFNKNIKLDARVIESEEFKKSFDTKSIEKALNKFKQNMGSELSIYEFIHKNPDNDIVKIAKQSDLIQIHKPTGKIDTRAFIDISEIKQVYENVEKLYSQYKSALTKNETSETFFKSLKKLKRNSVILNIGASILALGVITPAIMLIKRMTDKSGMEFETKRRIKEELIKEGVIT